MIKIKNKKLIYFTFYINNIIFSTNEQISTEKQTNISSIEKTTFLEKYTNMKYIKTENLIKSLLILFLIILFSVASISCQKKNIILKLIEETDLIINKHNKNNKNNEIPINEKLSKKLEKKHINFLKKIEKKISFIKNEKKYIFVEKKDEKEEENFTREEIRNIFNIFDKLIDTYSFRNFISKESQSLINLLKIIPKYIF